MEWIEILGIVAGICTTSAVIPQLKKALKTKKTMDVSIKMFIVLVIGFVLWIIYGVHQQDFPIILTNGVSLALNSLMILLILKYGRSGSNGKVK